MIVSRHLTVDRLLFGGAVLAVALCFPPFADLAPWQRSFATYVHGIVLESFPFLLLGSAVAGLVGLVLPDDLLPRLAGRLGWAGIPATLLLAPLTPVCECGVLPVARTLLAKGLPLPHTVAFLLAAPVLNPIVVLTTWLAFHDLRFPLFRVAGAAVVAIAMGALVARLGASRVLRDPTAVIPAAPHLRGVLSRGVPASFRRRTAGHAVRVAPVAAGPRDLRRRIGDVSGQILDHFLGMAGYFLIGVLIAAAMKTFLGGRLDALAGHAVGGPLALMGTSFVLSLCAEADAFIAAGFTAFDHGALIAFLVFGPMFDIKLLLMYRPLFTTRFLALLPAALALLVSLWVIVTRALWSLW